MTAPGSDARTATDLAEARSWLAEHRLGDAALAPLAGDLSPRRYLRVGSPPESYVLAHYPPSIRATFERFIRTGELLEAQGVRVPQVLARDAEQGWMLLEDLGPLTLYDAEGESWEALGGSYRAAIAAAARIQRIDAAVCSSLNPSLDAALLERELEQTWSLFLDPWAATGDPGMDRALREALRGICRRLEASGLRPCHRDFMARNLIPSGAGVAVLDHQDLRLGPICYDAASLFNDSLFPPREFELRWLEDGFEGACAAATLTADYNMAVVQRTLKAVGTYAAFAARGATRHVRLIEPTLRRAVRAFADTELGHGLAARWSPSLERGARALSATLIST